MPLVVSSKDLHQVSKRWIYYTYDDNSGWYNARWALFAIFVAFLLIFFFGTRLLNRRRLRAGQTVIPGTSWITPPSYFQSQRQYNNPPANTEYVPPYTEETSPHDMGYYDSDMKFHPNTKQNDDQPSSSNAHGSDNVDPLVSHPEVAVTHDAVNHNINTRLSHPPQPVGSMSPNVDTRPSINPPSGAIVEDVTGADVELHNLRPNGPPPAGH